jgi:hypothetical protein
MSFQSFRAAGYKHLADTLPDYKSKITNLHSRISALQSQLSNLQFNPAPTPAPAPAPVTQN